jgi:hypothetical protein
MDKIKIHRPLWLDFLNKSAIILLGPTILSMFTTAFYLDFYTILWGTRPGPIIKTALLYVSVLWTLVLCVYVAGLVADSRFCKPVWLRIKKANGQECPGCQYPGSVEVGGKCTECGMDFTPEIVERWRQWWSAEHMQSTLPNSGKWWYEQFRALFQSIHKLRQTRFFPSRSKPTPTPPTPDAPPPPQPDPLASKTDA